MTTASRRQRPGAERGQVSVLVVGLITSLMLVVGLAIDGGRVLAARARAIEEAQEAARAGAQQLSTTSVLSGHPTIDAARARTAAQAYLTAAGDTGSVEVVGTTVRVTVRMIEPMTLWRIAGIDKLTVAGDGSARALSGAG